MGSGQELVSNQYTGGGGEFIILKLGIRGFEEGDRDREQAMSHVRRVFFSLVESVTASNFVFSFHRLVAGDRVRPLDLILI